MGKLWQKVLERTRGSPRQPVAQITFHAAASPQISRAHSQELSPGCHVAYCKQPSDAAMAAAICQAVERPATHPGALSPAFLPPLVRSSSLGQENSDSIRHDPICSPDEVPDMETAFDAYLTANSRYESLVGAFEELRRLEYGGANQMRACFDYTGTGLFSYAQMDDPEHPMPSLPSFIRGRSKSIALQAMQSGGLASGSLEYELRERVLEHLETYADEHTAVFTATGGAALRLLGDCFPFSPHASLLLCYDHVCPHACHVAQLAASRGAHVAHAHFSWPDLRLPLTDFKRLLDSEKGGLVVLPVVSRVSGMRVDVTLRLVKEAQKRGWKVLLDASAIGPGDRINLQSCRPDYVVFSFYKVFGWDPTGFGCLLVRRPETAVVNGTGLGPGFGLGIGIGAGSDAGLENRMGNGGFGMGKGDELKASNGLMVVSGSGGGIGGGCFAVRSPSLSPRADVSFHDVKMRIDIPLLMTESSVVSTVPLSPLKTPLSPGVSSLADDHPFADFLQRDEEIGYMTSHSSALPSPSEVGSHAQLVSASCSPLVGHGPGGGENLTDQKAPISSSDLNLASTSSSSCNPNNNLNPESNSNAIPEPYPNTKPSSEPSSLPEPITTNPDPTSCQNSHRNTNLSSIITSLPNPVESSIFNSTSTSKYVHSFSTDGASSSSSHSFSPRTKNVIFQTPPSLHSLNTNPTTDSHPFPNSHSHFLSHSLSHSLSTSNSNPNFFETAEDQEWAASGSAYSRISSFSSVGQRPLGEGELECRGLDHLRDMGGAAVSKHLELLLEWLREALRRLRHPGREHCPLVEFYGPSSVADRGACLAFNIIDWKWDRVAPSLVQVLADRQNISVAVGQLYRYDSVASNGGIPKTNHSRVRGSNRSDDEKVMIDVVTISLGLVSNFADVYRLWSFVAQFLNPEFIYKESVEFQLLNKQTVKLS